MTANALGKNESNTIPDPGYAKNLRSCPYVRKRTERVCGKGQYEHRSGVEYLTPPYERKTTMLYTIAVVLVILWLLGLVTSYTMGGFIHVLLVVAIVIVLLRVISGRSAL